ncbi:NLR family CARD domain-containing protein 3-like [Hemibagrus wyckioides]|uniref:NLR family CARD domain-containing protein 3-like n=1 Tax=Hemibagrus wyckioides TaxID=337641 RepID=UPI00266C5DDA|nr:NLR family CARD domain-containing protein 3-like [Hemibagrus wyckioides]
MQGKQQGLMTTSIVPVPENSTASCLNDYRPVALTPIITKCFEWLVLAHLKTCLPATLDPHQFAYRQNRSTEDAVSTALHSVLSHVDNKDTYARMLFLDFSSVFNTVIPSKPQHVRIDRHCSSTPLFTYDCKPVHSSNTIIKFADDTTVIGLIKDNDESAYKEELDRLAECKLQGKRLESPAPSCISMKSDQSMDSPMRLKNGDQSLLHRNDPDPAAVNEVQKKFRLNLMKKFQCLNGVMINLGTQTLLNDIYTELYITEGDSGEVNNEHEVRQMEAASRRTTTEETPIKCNDIFKPLSEQDKPIRTVLTKGVAGIGKTVSVQKFILDWAEGKANQDVHLIFPLPFRELNLMKDQKLSLMELLHVCFKETKETEMSSLEKVLFIFDGLDECRFPLDFQNTVRVCDVTESASVQELLINLIKGNLLPSALIWITSRPAAADQIPSECVHRVTEVRGFSDPQKEEYFRKRISDQSLANNIITHLKSLRSLYIMCHIPVFCWISATVLERMLGEAESGEIPKTLTQMYTHFLIIQTNIIREKYSKKQESDEEMLLKLGQLAFQQLKKGNLIFYEEDLRECDIDVREAAVYSGVCTQIFREEFGLHQSKVYCFVHLTIQEHLAALYVHLTFMKEKRNVLIQNCVSTQKTEEIMIFNLNKSAVDQTLESQTAHLDLFLCFLLGLLLNHSLSSFTFTDQKLLHALVTQTGSSSQSTKATVHCLNELGDNSLVEKIQLYLKSGKQSDLSSSQWSALVFVLLTSAQELEEFDLSKYFSTDKITETVVLKMMPVIAASRKAIISCDSLGMKSCLALSSEFSNLRELHLTVKTLHLSYNYLGVSVVKSLSAVLENPHCKVETLGLRDCGVSDEGCAALTSALKSTPSHLIELNLSTNNLGDSGVKSLSAVLKNPHCKLNILGLCKCGVSDEGCAALTSALKSNPSHLRDLDLAEKILRDSGAVLVHHKIKTPSGVVVRQWPYKVPEACCPAIEAVTNEVLPFGLDSVPADLMKIVHSSNRMDHFHHLGEILRPFWKAGLMTNLSKCHLGLAKAHCMGQGLLQPEEKKIV